MTSKNNRNKGWEEQTGLKIASATTEIRRGFLVSVFQCQNIRVQSQRDDDYFRCLVLKHSRSGPRQHTVTEHRGKKTWPEKERQQG